MRLLSDFFSNGILVTAAARRLSEECAKNASPEENGRCMRGPRRKGTMVKHTTGLGLCSRTSQRCSQQRLFFELVYRNRELHRGKAMVGPCSRR